MQHCDELRSEALYFLNGVVLGSKKTHTKLKILMREDIPKVPLSTHIRTDPEMEIESTGSHELHKLDYIISPFKVILTKGSL